MLWVEIKGTSGSGAEEGALQQASWATLAGTESAIAGAGAGLVGATVTCPLDVIKTKLQASSNSRYRGLVHTFEQILVDEGVRGLYRGLGPTILGYCEPCPVYFDLTTKLIASTQYRLGPSISRSCLMAHKNNTRH